MLRISWVIFFSLLTAAPCLAAPTVEMARNVPVNPRTYQTKKYPWRTHIVATVFWVGEAPAGRNKTPNNKSSWDTNWQKNFGGYDNPDPSRRIANFTTMDFRPAAIKPKLNPFYIALPYNDVMPLNKHKPEASRVIPWFKRSFIKAGKSVCNGRWIEIVYGKKRCYAQWSDCGPWTTTDWRYVFGGQRPANKENNSAGIDISPSVRDYLGMRSGDKVHWRFIEFAQVPRRGPWTKYGHDNPFVHPQLNPDRAAKRRYLEHLRKLRDQNFRASQQ